MIDYRLTLDYRLGTGWITPFFDALAEGRALGRKCRPCGKVSFPPERVCPCGSDAGDWQALTGKATILFRTNGSDGAFALARFEGVDWAATVRLAEGAEDANEGQIIRPPDAPPHICLAPIPKEHEP